MEWGWEPPSYRLRQWFYFIVALLGEHRRPLVLGKAATSNSLEVSLQISHLENGVSGRTVVRGKLQRILQ